MEEVIVYDYVDILSIIASFSYLISVGFSIGCVYTAGQLIDDCVKENLNKSTICSVLFVVTCFIALIFDFVCSCVTRTEVIVSRAGINLMFINIILLFLEHYLFYKGRRGLVAGICLTSCILKYITLACLNSNYI